MLRSLANRDLCSLVGDFANNHLFYLPTLQTDAASSFSALCTTFLPDP